VWAGWQIVCIGYRMGGGRPPPAQARWGCCVRKTRERHAVRMTRHTGIIIVVVCIIWIAADLATVLRTKIVRGALMSFVIAVIAALGSGERGPAPAFPRRE
jgi:hypothetical protein